MQTKLEILKSLEGKNIFLNENSHGYFSISVNVESKYLNCKILNVGTDIIKLVPRQWGGITGMPSDFVYLSIDLITSIGFLEEK